MKPRAFYIGFPPALVKVRRNGIEYGIGAIPAGRLRAHSLPWRPCPHGAPRSIRPG
jgi:hypothetical protein